MNIAFKVYGDPKPQGSARAFIPKGWNRAVITSDNKKLKPWRQEISGSAAAAMNGARPYDGPVSVFLDFYFIRPKSTSKKVTSKITKPDLDKLARAVLDGLTGHCFRDDSQVVMLHAVKHFGDAAHAEIKVMSFEHQG